MSCGISCALAARCSFRATSGTWRSTQWRSWRRRKTVSTMRAARGRSCRPIRLACSRGVRCAASSAASRSGGYSIGSRRSADFQLEFLELLDLVAQLGGFLEFHQVRVAQHLFAHFDDQTRDVLELVDLVLLLNLLGRAQGD